MYVRVSIPDILAVAGIGAASWATNDHSVGWGMWIALAAFGIGRLVQWLAHDSR